MKLGWCVSGSGTGARAVIEAQEAGIIRTPISVIVMDRPSGLSEYSEARGIPIFVGDANTWESMLMEQHRTHSLDCLGLTFNRLLSKATINAFSGKVFNLHMSLLPKYPGFGAMKEALANRDTVAGITIHYADEGTDSGPHIFQSTCPVFPVDTVSSLGRRQFELAVPALIQTVRAFEDETLVTAIDDDIAEFSEKFCKAIPVR